MNKGKLRSLMFHAGFCNEDGGWDNRPLFEQEHDNFQRFAELIVRECMKVAVNKDSGYIHPANIAGYMAAGRSTAAQMIKEHFGVEE